MAIAEVNKNVNYLEFDQYRFCKISIKILNENSFINLGTYTTGP